MNRSLSRVMSLSSLAMLLFAFAQPAHAAPQQGLRFEQGALSLTVNGQLRLRGITDSGRDLLDTQIFAREYFTQRSRLGATLAHQGGAALSLQLQDSRVWGEESNTLNDYSANGLDLHQAFVIVPLYKHLTLKAGRQEMIFDNHRLVGNVGWTQRARSFDALRLFYTRGALRADLFFSLLSEMDRDGDGQVPGGDNARTGDQTFGGAHLNYKFAKTHSLSLAWYDRSNVPARHYRHTLGLDAKGKIAGASYEAEFYYQLGSQAGSKVTALLAALNVGYSLQVATRPALTLRAEYLSGDGTPQGTFDTLFATNHKFYGEMDFFLNIPKHTANLGLVDLGGRVSAVPTRWLKTQLDLHLLRSAVADPQGAQDFGTELDLKFIVALKTHVSLRFLYGVMLPGDALIGARGVAAADGSSFEHFAYLTLDLKL